MTGSVLRAHDELLPDILAERNAPAQLGGLVLVTVCCGALYGAVLGMWRSPLLAAYVAVKMPLLLISTALLTAVINWMVAVLWGVPIRFGQSVLIALTTLAIGSAALASLAPVAWLFTVSLPPPSEHARTLHNLLYLTHTLVVAAAGLTGSVALRDLLQRTAGTRAKATRVYRAWIASFALVGGQVAWILRPFVGSVYLPVRFMREDAFHGNVYEFIVTDILPHLLGGTT